MKFSYIGAPRLVAAIGSPSSGDREKLFLSNDADKTMISTPFFLRQLLQNFLAGLFIFTLALFCQPAVSQGQEAAITDFTVLNSESELLLYLEVTDWLSEDMQAAIENGIPITFTFTIELLAERPNWPDRKIREYEFNHTVVFDSLKKEYAVQRTEKNDSRVAASLKEAAMLMSEINGFQVARLDELDTGVSYRLRANAKLARKNLPLYFHYLVPFSSPWAFKTKWYELTLRLTP